jgi:hypothetical protein
MSTPFMNDLDTEYEDAYDDAEAYDDSESAASRARLRRARRGW